MLAHGFGGFGLWLSGPIVFGTVVKRHFMARADGQTSYSPHGGQEARARKRPGSHVPSDLRPPTRPHLLKVPPPPNNTAHGPLGDSPDPKHSIASLDWYEKYTS
jgi:hypothetical protein